MTISPMDIIIIILCSILPRFIQKNHRKYIPWTREVLGRLLLKTARDVGLMSINIVAYNPKLQDIF